MEARGPATPSADPGRRAGGFTFIELLVALAILSFAFAYGIVHLDGATAPARLAAAARQLGSTIEFLRGHAIHASRPVEMEVDLTGVEIDGVRRHRFRSVLPPRPSESDSDRRDQESVLQTEWIYLPKWIRLAGVRMSARQTEETGLIVLTFSPLGEISPNGFLIRLESDEIAAREHSVFSVEVNGLTGEVSYVPGEVEFDQVVDGDSFR